jgi:RHS repeat-associated protein
VEAGRYGYDPYGRRLVKEAGGVTTYFLYADSGLVAEFAQDGAELKSYGYRPGAPWGSNPLFMMENNQRYWYLNDHLGTPQQLIDQSGAVVWSARYTAYGQALVNPASTVENNLRFPGQYYDGETGLHYNWHRYYDPGTGRYMTPDPLGLDGGDFNLYAYVGGDPVNWYDFYGLFSLGDAKKSLKKRKIPPKSKGTFWDTYSDTQIFDEWLRLERANQDWLEELTPCPPKKDECTEDKWLEPNTDVSQKYHPGGAFEVRSKTTPGNHSNQCIYDENGNLMTEIPAAGTADFRPCPNPPFCTDHYIHDVRPFEKSEKLKRVPDYYDVRPSLN